MPAALKSPLTKGQRLCRADEGFFRHVGSPIRLCGPAHLEPEILLVDEVLSVGDIQFRKSARVKSAMWRREDEPSFSSVIR